MTEPTTAVPTAANVLTPSDEPAASRSRSEHRRADDRRAVRAPGRRGKKQSAWVRYLGIAGRDLGIIVATLSAIIFSVRHTHPIYANSEPVAQALIKRAPVITKTVLAPPPVVKDTSPIERLVNTPEFKADRTAFAADLVATGRMSQARADSIAFYAVREAYIRHIPPAVVFGVMLTENAQFVSKAMSDVGAVGLMQIYPKVWLKALSAKFGKDLASDSTNLKYGIYILSEYVKTDSGRVLQRDLTKGLLRYNGCVRGTHTPHCRTYPTKVQTYVEKQGSSICGDKSFYDCIAKPFVAGLFGSKSEDTE